jgi:hypothetical protein
MDFYIDIAFAVLLRLLKTPKHAQPYFAALAKLHEALEKLMVMSPTFRAEVEKRQEP